MQATIVSPDENTHEDESAARLKELKEAREEATSSATEDAHDEGELDSDGAEVVADEGGDDEGHQAVGPDDQAIVCCCRAFHLSKPRKSCNLTLLYQDNFDTLGRMEGKGRQ